MHECDGGSGGHERLRGGEVVDLVDDVWGEAGLRAQVLYDRTETAGGCVAPWQDQRLLLEIAQAHLLTSRERVAVGQNAVQVVDEQAPPP